MNDSKVYQSPFSWRYGSQEMREIWGEYNTRLLWREIWVCLAEVQSDYQLVSSNQAAELRSRMRDIDLALSDEIELETQHDLMAELQVFAEQCPSAGGILHLGATSMDIKDNAVILQIKESLQLILKKLEDLLILLSNFIDQWADVPLIGFTHLQPAEPSTLGYRFAGPAQDLLSCFQLISSFVKGVKSKGFCGAVGTSASFGSLIGEENLAEFQEKLANKLDLSFFDVVSQTYPRIQDYQLLSHLAGLGAVLYKLAFDLRILQSPLITELAEPFGEKQIGSSAMPNKQNPIMAEKINSLGRYLAQLPRTAWDNAAHSLLERTMDDSANRRIILPESFLITDELLQVSRDIFSGLQIFKESINRNFAEYAPFAFTERLLLMLTKAGGDRQQMHKLLRKHTSAAWSAVRQGKPNPLKELASVDPDLLKYLSEDEILQALEGEGYLGDAERRARQLAADIKKEINS
jgi:adenylosuccinate lyase